MIVGDDVSPVFALIDLCPDCGAAQHIPELPKFGVAECHRCGADLVVAGPPRLQPLLAVSVATFFLYFPATFLPLMWVGYSGNYHDDILATGVNALQNQGYLSLAGLVYLFTVVVPLLWISGFCVVLGTLLTSHRPAWLGPLFRAVDMLRPWAMPEIFLVGGFVAFNRMQTMAETTIGIGGMAFMAYAALVLAIDLMMNRRGLWEAILPSPPLTHGRGAFACYGCGYPLQPSDHVTTEATIACPRCATRVSRRKRDAFKRCAALIATAAILYIPANLLPVLTISEIGYEQTSNTILSGVKELVDNGDWPIAALVFTASIFVPLMKLLGLSWCLAMISRRSSAQILPRTRLYRFIDFVGRWSNIDVFMASILAAMVDFGKLETVQVEPGAVAFAAVVVLTMVASASFDPRLMWDAAEQTG